MRQDKQDRRSQRTRRLVTAALMELMTEKRYDAITVQDLLDRAGIARSTFYVHYFDKEDVLASVAEQMLGTLGQPFSQREAGQRIIPSLALFRHAQEHSQPFRAMLRAHAGERLWGTVEVLLRRTIEQALTTAGEGNRFPSIPLAVVAQYLAGAFLSLLKWWVEAEMPYPPEQMDQIFQQLAFHGVWAPVVEQRDDSTRGGFT